jgi:hypothetical protein
MKSIYIDQLISHQKGDAKELKRARRRSLEVEVKVKINGSAKNINKLWIMMHAIAQTMLLNDIFSECNLLLATSQDVSLHGITELVFWTC